VAEGEEKEVQAFLAALGQRMADVIETDSRTRRERRRISGFRHSVLKFDPLIQHHHDVICTAFGCGICLGVDFKDWRRCPGWPP